MVRIHSTTLRLLNPMAIIIQLSSRIAQRKIRLATPWQTDFGSIGCHRCSEGTSFGI